MFVEGLAAVPCFLVAVPCWECHAVHCDVYTETCQLQCSVGRVTGSGAHCAAPPLPHPLQIDPQTMRQMLAELIPSGSLDLDVSFPTQHRSLPNLAVGSSPPNPLQNLMGEMLGTGTVGAGGSDGGSQGGLPVLRVRTQNSKSPNGDSSGFESSPGGSGRSGGKQRPPQPPPAPMAKSPRAAMGDGSDGYGENLLDPGPPLPPGLIPRVPGQGQGCSGPGPFARPHPLSGVLSHASSGAYSPHSPHGGPGLHGFDSGGLTADLNRMLLNSSSGCLNSPRLGGVPMGNDMSNGGSVGSDGSMPMQMGLGPPALDVNLGLGGDGNRGFAGQGTPASRRGARGGSRLGRNIGEAGGARGGARDLPAKAPGRGGGGGRARARGRGQAAKVESEDVDEGEGEAVSEEAEEDHIIRPHNGGEARRINKQMLQDVYHLPINAAATELGIGVTVLKKYCRRFEVRGC